MKSPQEIVSLMLDNDQFSKWLDVKVLSIECGACRLQCTTHPEMVNGFGILHGGITYSLSDSALAFASNAYGNKCVSIETSISHLRPVKINETLEIHCEEIHRGKSIGIYHVTIYNEQKQPVSTFKGTVHISQERW